MNRRFPLPFCVGLLITIASSAWALDDSEQKAVEQLIRDYASWHLSRQPANFKDRLDLDSYDEQRPLLIELAEINWIDWGRFWSKFGIHDITALKALPREKFWSFYHTPDDDPARKVAGFDATKIAIDIHAVTEARGLVYVVFEFLHDGLRQADGDIQVQRAKKIGGRWLLLAPPGTAKVLTQQLKSFKRELPK